MPTAPLQHTLERNLDEVLISVPSESLALVDLESYPAYLGRNVDYFDMMAHLSDQMQALTAMAWKAPERALHFRLRLTGDEILMEQSRPNRVMIASGNVRCYGQFCLATHERLFDSARHRGRDLLRGGRLPQLSRAQVINVPPGIYSIFIYYQASFAYHRGVIGGPEAAPRADYDVLLRHYPFPPPRVAPIRLSSGVLHGATREVDGSANGVITSHARIW